MKQLQQIYYAPISMEINIESLKPYIESLTSKQKDKLLYQLLKKDKLLVEQLYFKHLSTSEDLDERYEDFLEEVKQVLLASYRAKSDELAVAKGIGEAKKVINRFTKVDKRPEKEAKLLMLILDAVFKPGNPARLGTCWTKYDLTVAQTLKRLITIIKNKLHEDYLMNFKPEVDKYLIRIKSASSFNDIVYDLPSDL